MPTTRQTGLLPCSDNPPKTRLGPLPSQFMDHGLQISSALFRNSEQHGSKMGRVNPNSGCACAIRWLARKHARGEEQWLHLPVDR